MPTPQEKKEIELFYLIKAQKTGNLMPEGKIDDSKESPDLRLDTERETIGIEVTEMFCPPAKPDQLKPIVTSDIRKRIICASEKIYYSNSPAIPICVNVAFDSSRINKRDEAKVSESLAEVVMQAAILNVDPSATLCLSRNMSPEELGKLPEGLRKLPEHILALSVWREDRSWQFVNDSGITLEQIIDTINERIRAKEPKIELYRQNMPGSPLWLLPLHPV